MCMRAHGISGCLLSQLYGESIAACRLGCLHWPLEVVYLRLLVVENMEAHLDQHPRPDETDIAYQICEPTVKSSFEWRMMSPLSCHVFFAEKPTCRYNLDDHDGTLLSGCSVLLEIVLSDIVSTKSLGLKRNNAKNVSLRNASDYPVFNRK